MARLISVAVLGAVLALAPQPNRVESLLDAYAAGNHDSAVRSAAGDSGAATVDALRREFERHAPAWIARNPSDEHRRRLIVVSLVLETAVTTDRTLRHRERDAAFSRFRTAEAMRPFLEWACALMRTSPGDDATDRAWWLASVEGQLHEWINPDALYGSDTFASGWTGVVDKRSHLAHARTRFPNDSRFALAAALQPVEVWPIGEVFVSILGGRELPPARVQQVAVSLPSMLGKVNEHGEDGSAARRTVRDAQTIRAWQHMIAALRPLEHDPVVGNEVRLYLAAVALCLGDHVTARRAFDDLAHSGNGADMTYLASFLRGRLEERDGESRAAEDAYRTAVGVVPRASSATIALASLLSRDGRADEAAVLVEALITGPVVDDPWVNFVDVQGISRWRADIATLRGQLR